MTTAARLAACALAALLAVGCVSTGNAPAAYGASDAPAGATPEDEEILAIHDRAIQAIRDRRRLAGYIVSGDIARAEEVASRIYDESLPSSAGDNAGSPGSGGTEADPSGRVRFFSGLLMDYGRPDDAEDVLMKALLANPRSASLMNDLAYLWACRDMELEHAEALANKALEYCPDEPAFLDTLGWILYRRGQFTQAGAFTARAIDLGGPDPTILDHMGDILFALGEDDYAICHWLDSLSIDPNQPPVVEKLREAWLKTVVERKSGLEPEPEMDYDDDGAKDDATDGDASDADAPQDAAQDAPQDGAQDGGAPDGGGAEPDGGAD